MVGAVTEDKSHVSANEMSIQYGDSLTEWRSPEQVENGTPCTSTPFWDIDDEDDCGPKPSELYGKFTWKIEKFSEINKRELRSNAFEVGGYKWYVLIYPQGCDVCNHISLFLCVANHDRLLPGWSHFAQFTIAVEHVEPKKSKKSDTLHRFWKKEHDWGWKKFIELSKVSDGFIVNDTLVINAQVQVIREKAHRLFRCLDCQYRRELARVYLSNVEQICRRFVEERRGKISKLIEDRSRWLSFCEFWVQMDQNARFIMSRYKMEAILKVVVKQFFIEKEVTSTLVIDCLYGGLKALEYQSNNKKGNAKLLEMGFPAPMVLVEGDMFVLADDVLKLLERVASEMLPHQPLPPKDDKGSQNHAKDTNSSDDFNKDIFERDERRLTDLGHKTIEFYILVHIFSRIEIAYKEAVALKRQEELIREEEAATQAEIWHKTKSGAQEKEKHSKKKQAKQKRNSRKHRNKTRDEKDDVVLQGKHQQKTPSNVRMFENSSPKQAEFIHEKIEKEDDISDEFDMGNDAADVLQVDGDERDGNTNNWDTDTSEIQPPTDTSSSEVPTGQVDKKSLSLVDDSSSTCSSDSVPWIVMHGPNKGNLFSEKKSHSPSRGKSQWDEDLHNQAVFTDGSREPTDASTNSGCSGDSTTSPDQPELASAVTLSRKKEALLKMQKSLAVKNPADAERLLQLRTQHQKQSSESTHTTSTPLEPLSIPLPSKKSASQATRWQHTSSILKCEVQREWVAPSRSSTVHQVNSMSRPSSAPLSQNLEPTSMPKFSNSQTTPQLSRSVSAAGRLGTNPSPSGLSYFPQSYRNVIMGKTKATTSSSDFLQSEASACSQASTMVSSAQSPSPSPPTSITKDQNSCSPESSSVLVKLEAIPICQPDNDSPGICEVQKKHHIGGHALSVGSLRPTNGIMHDEFPHLDIINDLLDDEQSIEQAMNYHQLFSQEHLLPDDMASTQMCLSNCNSLFDHAELCYNDIYDNLYGSTRGAFGGLMNGHPQQLYLSDYPQGLIDGLIQNQWPYNATEPLMPSVGIAGANGYSHQFPDFNPMLEVDVDGYSIYQGL